MAPIKSIYSPAFCEYPAYLPPKGRNMLRLRSITVVAALLLCSLFSVAKDAKLTPDELVQKALAAIGTPETRAAQTARQLAGNIEFKRMSNSGVLVHGPVSFTTAPNKIKLMATLNATNYQQEDISFDGDKVNIAYVNPSGVRSRLGQFVFEHEAILREGLFGGPLSAANPLANLSARQVTLHYDGLKKIDGQELHQLSYYPRKNPDSLTIKLFFEPETFHHVRTIYSWEQPMGMKSNEIANARAQRFHYQLEERFSEFRPVNSITLPAIYEIRLNTDANGAGYSYLLTFDHYNNTEFAPTAAK